jgi:hypothetical protein
LSSCVVEREKESEDWSRPSLTTHSLRNMSAHLRMTWSSHSTILPFQQTAHNKIDWLRRPSLVSLAKLNVFYKITHHHACCGSRMASNYTVPLCTHTVASSSGPLSISQLLMLRCMQNCTQYSCYHEM